MTTNFASPRVREVCRYTGAMILFLGALYGQELSVTGTVVDQTNAAISGARVKLERESPRAEWTAATNDQGAYTFSGTGSGSFRLHIETDGFQTLEETVELAAGSNQLPSFTLRPATVQTMISVVEGLGYKVPAVVSATKMPTLLIDVPQSVEAVSHRVIEEQGALSMNDVLRNVSGVSPSLGEGRRDHMLIRGFSAVNDEYIDGVRDDALYYRDLSNVENVEVLKGPAAVLFGRGSSGGLVNRVTKKPEGERPMGELKVMAGSYGEKRMEFDASQPFGNKLAGRLTGAYEDGGSHRDFYNLNRYAFAPSLLWKPTDATDVLGQFEYLNDERLPDRGIPSVNGGPAPVRLGAYYGYPEDDYIRSHAASAALTLNHRFSSRWTFHDVFRGTDYSTAFSNTYSNDASLTSKGWMVARAQYNGSVGQQNLFNQSEVTGGGSWLGMEHVLLGGLELGHQDKDTAQFTGTAAAVALVNPVLTRPVYTNVPGTLNAFGANIAGVYLQDQISWRRWRVLAGARHDRFEQQQDSLLPGVPRLGRVDYAWSPRVGVVYHVLNPVSVYASYTKTFDPSGEALSLAVNNAQLEPEKTRNVEAGAKWDLAGGRFMASAAVFRLDRTNIKTSDPQDPTKLILVGAQRTDGVEVSLSGRVWRSLEVSGGYAWFGPIILRSNSLSSGVLIQGKIPGLVPRQSGSMWASYSWQNGFGIGAGAFQASRRFTANDDLVALPGYVRFDAAVFYRHRRWGASFNLHNLLNRTYYETAQGNSQIYPGAPANGLLTMTYRW